MFDRYTGIPQNKSRTNIVLQTSGILVNMCGELVNIRNGGGVDGGVPMSHVDYKKW